MYIVMGLLVEIGRLRFKTLLYPPPPGSFAVLLRQIPSRSL